MWQINKNRGTKQPETQVYQRTVYINTSAITSLLGSGKGLKITKPVLFTNEAV
jgi:hypothetical protein